MGFRYLRMKWALFSIFKLPKNFVYRSCFATLLVIVVFCTIFAGGKSLFLINRVRHFFTFRFKSAKIKGSPTEKHFRGVKLNRCEKNRLNRKRSRFRFFQIFRMESLFSSLVFCAPELANNMNRLVWRMRSKRINSIRV